MIRSTRILGIVLQRIWVVQEGEFFLQRVRIGTGSIRLSLAKAFCPFNTLTARPLLYD